MKRILIPLVILAFFCIPKAQAQLQVPSFASDPATCDPTRGLQYYNTTTQTMKYCSAVNTWSPISAATTNGIYAIGYGVYADTLNVQGCSGTSGTNSVTCTGPGIGNGGAFISSDIGKTVWCSDGSFAPNLSPTTISGITSGTVFTTTANLTHNLSAGYCSYGHDDTAALNTAWAALVALPNCANFILPSGGMIISSAILYTNPTGCNVSQYPTGIQITGQGPQNSLFYVSPAFTYNTTSRCSPTGATNNNSCFGPGPAQVSNLGFYSGWTGQVTYANTFNGCWITITTPGAWLNVVAQNIHVTGNANGACITSGAAWWNNVQWFGIAGTGTGSSLLITASDVTIFNSYLTPEGTAVGTGITVNVPASTYTTNLTKISGVGTSGSTVYPYLFEGGGTVVLNDVELGAEAMQISGAGTAVLGNGIVGNATGANVVCGANVLTGATLHLTNSRLANTAVTSAQNGVCLDATSTFVDGSGNVFAYQNGAFKLANGSTVKSTQKIAASCTGVATASSTLGLYGTGSNEILSTCTSTTIGNGIVAQQPGTLSALYVTATAGGVNASSGVVTVLKNGSATAITCTIGTGTNCIDSTHTVSVAQNDLISLQFTTQLADTLAGVSASVYLGN